MRRVDRREPASTSLRLGVAALALALAGSAGCDGGRPTLTVRVQSGLRAGHEVRFVEASVFRGSVSCGTAVGARQSEGRALGPDEQAALGAGTVTVGEFPRLEAGTYTIRVQARRPGEGSPDSGPVLIERCVVTSLSNDRVVRVALTSDCINVSCPAPGGSPAFDQCLNGRCVDPRCDPGDPATAELCCDRTVLGNTCDDDPTLCRSATDCTPTLMCSGAPTCVDGACIEPVTDGCSEGAYCDATLNECRPDPEIVPPDAGPRDASVGDGSSDAGALDVGSPDTGSLDAASFDAVVPSPDTSTADAFVPMGVDAPVADAFTPRASDAFVGADVGGSVEDCTLLGDEDGDGVQDCADSECASTRLCTDGCDPVSLPTPPVDPPSAPAATHWYRADGNLALGPGGRVCAVRDLRGGAHLFATAGSLSRPGSVGGQPTLILSLGRVLVASGDLGVRMAGGFTIFVVSSAPAALTGFPTIRSWAPDSSTEFFSLLQARGPASLFELQGHTTRWSVGSTPGTASPHIEMVSVTSVVPAEGLASHVTYARDGVTTALGAITMGSGVAEALVYAGTPELRIGPPASGNANVSELLIYDRVLDAAESDAVYAYLDARYGP